MDALDKLFSKIKKEEAPSHLAREIFQRVSFEKPKSKMSFFNIRLLTGSLAVTVLILSGVAFSTYYQYYRIENEPTAFVDNYIPKPQAKITQETETEKEPAPKPTTTPTIVKAPTPTSTSLVNNFPPTYSASTTSKPTLGAAQVSKQYLDIKINGSDNPSPVGFNSLVEVSWMSSGVKDDSCSVYGQNVPLEDGRSWLDLSSKQKSNISLKVYAKDKELGYVNNITLGVKCEDVSGNMVKDDINFQVVEQ